MSIKFTETIAQLRQRVRREGYRPPLRTFKEMCAELGVPERTMMGKMKMEGAPKPVVINRAKLGSKASWYNPAEFKKWWRSINASE